MYSSSMVQRASHGCGCHRLRQRSLVAPARRDADQKRPVGERGHTHAERNCPLRAKATSRYRSNVRNRDTYLPLLAAADTDKGVSLELRVLNDNVRTVGSRDAKLRRMASCQNGLWRKLLRVPRLTTSAR